MFNVIPVYFKYVWCYTSIVLTAVFCMTVHVTDSVDTPGPQLAPLTNLCQQDKKLVNVSLVVISLLFVVEKCL